MDFDRCPSNSVTFCGRVDSKTIEIKRVEDSLERVRILTSKAACNSRPLNPLPTCQLFTFFYNNNNRVSRLSVPHDVNFDPQKT